MIYLLAYDGYMKEKKIQEACPSVRLFIQRGLKDCALGFHRFYEAAMPTLEQGEEIVPAVIWKLKGSDLKNMEAIYPNEIYQRTSWNLRTEKGVLGAIISLMREIPFTFPREKEVEAMEEVYEGYNFDYSNVENTLSRAGDRGEAYGALYPGTDQ